MTLLPSNETFAALLDHFHPGGRGGVQMLSIQYSTQYNTPYPFGSPNIPVDAKFSFRPTREVFYLERVVCGVFFAHLPLQEMGTPTVFSVFRTSRDENKSLFVRL